MSGRRDVLTGQYLLDMPLVGLETRKNVEAFQNLCEKANELKFDKVGLNLLKKLASDERHGGLSAEHTVLLEMVRKISDGQIIFGPSGWCELPEKPKEGEE